MTKALDTNCIIRWLLWDIEAQAKEVDLILEGTDSQVHIADLAIFEAWWVLQSFYKFDNKNTAELLEKVVIHPKVNCNKKLFLGAFKEMDNESKVLFVDVCLVGYATISGQDELVTFDKDLNKKFPSGTKLLTSR